MTRIRKAIFPVAGLGTRFLPATKAMPKEMLPVVDRPLIQHVVDEARQAGIEHFIFVTGRNKSVIEDHFDRQFELELTLTERGKKAELALLSEDLPEAGTVSFRASNRRSAWAMRSGARVNWSAMSRSHCCCRTSW
jgi:UTP--glucose-1-phosphate uridylyltransferase